MTGELIAMLRRLVEHLRQRDASHYHGDTPIVRAAAELLQRAEGSPDMTLTKAKLWDTLSAALMSRSGITLDNERDCYEAARQWAEASDDAHSYKMAAAKAREDRDAVAALKVELLTIPLSPHDPRQKLDG